MKKIVFSIIVFLIGIVGVVSAKEVQVYFYANGGTASSSNIEVSDGIVTLKSTGDYYASYQATDTIKAINSINNEKFTLKKQGTKLVSGQEWYTFDKNGKVYYFSESKSYKVSDMLTILGKANEASPMIDMYANWEGENIKGNIVKIRYHVNGGKLETTSKNITEDKSYIRCNGSTYCEKKRSTEMLNPSRGLANYNHASGINIVKKGYTAKKGAEWNTRPDGKGKSYSQDDLTYKMSDFCDASEKDCTVTLYVNWAKNINWGLTETQIKEIESGKRKITYELFGAKPNDSVNDFAAIWKAHQFANYELIEKGNKLTVYACGTGNCSGKKYYIKSQTCPMSEFCNSNQVPIYVGTSTDLENATVILDDGASGVDPTIHAYKIINTLNLHQLFKKDGTFVVYLNNAAKKAISDSKIIKPNATTLKTIVNLVRKGEIYTSNDSNPKKASEAQQQILLNAKKWGLTIENDNLVYKRVSHNHTTGEITSVNKDDGKKQTDEIIIDNQGNVLTPIDWTNAKINRLMIYPIDNNKKTFKNAYFITYTDNKVYEKEKKGKKNTARNRNIFIQYSGNVELKNIYHSLEEGIYRYDSSSFQDNPTGNVYYGFISLQHAGNIKIENVKLVPHSRVKIYGTTYNYEGTYDLIIDNSMNVSLNNVTHNCKSNDSKCYNTQILSEEKWGIMGMNNSKNVWFTNCTLNRIDAHRGITNLYVENTIIGVHGFTVAGQGNFYSKNITIEGADRIIKLRDDYGATWNGEMIFNGVDFMIQKNINQATFVLARNYQNWDYGYKSYFPNLFMNNITINTKAKNSNASRVNVLDLAFVDKMDRKNPNNLYYFNKIISISNLKFNNFKTQPSVYLFTDGFNNKQTNYLVSRYGGESSSASQVAVYTQNVNYNSNFSSKYNTKFKKASTTTVDGHINDMEKFFKNLKTKAGI